MSLNLTKFSRQFLATLATDIEALAKVANEGSISHEMKQFKMHARILARQIRKHLYSREYD